MAANPATGPSPDRIVEIATGHMAARQLFAAARTGLFRAAAAGEHTVAQLAAATGLDERVTRILADAMNGLGLLERRDGRYRLAADTAEYLCGAGERDLHPFLRFLGEISYEVWNGFDTTVDTGRAGKLSLDDNQSATFMAGVMRYNDLHAAMLARAFDFGPYRNMLDFGGLSPAFAIDAMRANPQLTVDFVFAPDFAAELHAAVEQAGLADRARIDPAPTETAKPGGAHDLVMLNHVIHRFDPAQNRVILAAARDAALPGARLLLLDFLLDDEQRQRRIDALHAGEYLVVDGTVVYPCADVDTWLEAAGWRRREVLALPGSPRVIVAEAV